MEGAIALLRRPAHNCVPPTKLIGILQGRPLWPPGVQQTSHVVWVALRAATRAAPTNGPMVATTSADSSVSSDGN